MRGRGPQILVHDIHVKIESSDIAQFDFKGAIVRYESSCKNKCILVSFCSKLKFKKSNCLNPLRSLNGSPRPVGLEAPAEYTFSESL